MEYKEIYTKVFEEENRPLTNIGKVKLIAKIIRNENKYHSKSYCVWEAIEMFNDMAMYEFDPTQSEIEEILSSLE